MQSKSVTSCAGMTAHFVLLAQTKVGFLSGGRSRRMKELPEKEVLAQLEEAYARATVALTRAQKLCIIMGPLDMRGLLGAATVIGCLKYGAGVCGVHVNNPSAEVFLKDGSLNAGPDDSAFLQSLRRSLKTSRGAYPPLALAEIYREYKLPLTKIRRLHLMVVDLDRSRSVSTYVYQDFMKCHIPTDLAGCLNTLPVPISRVMTMQRVVLTKRTVTAPAQTLTLAAKMTLRMFLIWRNLKKRIPTSVPSLMEWTHELWNGIALVTQMRRCLVLTYLAGWRRYTP